MSAIDRTFGGEMQDWRKEKKAYEALLEDKDTQISQLSDKFSRARNRSPLWICMAFSFIILSVVQHMNLHMANKSIIELESRVHAAEKGFLTWTDITTSTARKLRTCEVLLNEVQSAESPRN